MVVTFCSTLGACAKVSQTPTGSGGSGPGDAGGLDYSRPIFDGTTISDAILTTCGNSKLDLSEGCDDGNKVGGDGCTPLCQVESDWDCPNVGMPCVFTARCGDMKLSSNEACDDGNMANGDGCSMGCMVESGWVCRVPGKPCSPLCGDGVLTGMPPKNETCDDRNTTSGDGCSATCQLEPGASCPAGGGACTTAVCGNGMVEAGEGCDAGMLNGLFFGDASGCSKTCTKEPTCRDADGKTRACDTSCGNGNIEASATPPEACDDGNLKNGDGCSSTCTLEGGFTCSPEMKPDTVACTQQGNAGQCLQLPIIYRDFKNESVSGGHPDFFFLGAPVMNPPSISGVQGQAGALSFSKRYCVPNSSGPAKKNDSVNRCWDIAAPNLGPKGKPVFNMARTGGTNCDCQFIDWSHDTNGGHVPGYTAAANSPTTGLTYVDGASGHPMYRGPAPIVTSAASFGQWWVDGTYTGGTHTVGTLEMAAVGGLFQFSSQVNTVTGGFFPLDPPGQFPLYGVAGPGPGAIRMIGTEALLCNLWPYWYSSAAFGAGAACKGDQYLFPPSLLPPDTAVMFPNGKWYGAGTTPALGSGWFHDSWFTDEVRYLFVHNGAFSLQFYGDDDMFIYINGVLVIDLGGVHQRLPGRVDVNADGSATIIEGGSLDAAGTMILPCPSPDPYTMLTMNAAANADGNGHMNCTTPTCDCRARTVTAAQMGNLTVGRTYEIAVFGADRHPTESNYQLTLSGFATNKSNCQPRCGDGVITGAEECDDGAMNNDATYGGCSTTCKFGPYCGDGMLNTPEEQCDRGRTMPPPAGNGATYGGRDGCTIGCTFPHYCGDGFVDTAGGEQCDQGETINGTKDAPCQADCKIKPIG